MCGISIAIHKEHKPVPQPVIQNMNQAIHHRGPDDEGFFLQDHLAFGHRRLSILDLGPTGHQPMVRDQYVIVYNGEVYNYLELKEELMLLGHHFESSSDTEVILAAYQQWGVNAFARFNGMWAFAIYDPAQKRVILCRDHFGIKPLYFTHTEGYFLAGSEIKQFLSVPGFEPRLNTGIALNFLATGLLNQSQETFFQGVLEVPPGNYLLYHLDTNEVETITWYDLRQAIPITNPTITEAIDQVRSLFFESVRIRMRSDVPVGSCLSGGIDSSAIVTTVHTLDTYHPDFATITSCYTQSEYDEQKFSDLVSDQTGFQAFKIFPDLENEEVMAQLDQMIYHQDQPIKGLSHFSEFSVFKQAAVSGLTVMLDGQGSDEYFCGYHEFYALHIRELIMNLQFGKALHTIRTKARFAGRKAIQELKIVAGSHYLSPLNFFIPKKKSQDDSEWIKSEWKKFTFKKEEDYPTANIRELSLQELNYFKLPYQLHSEDRHSMMFSIESRLPFLDPRLVEYVLSLPSEYKIKNGYLKYILREAISELPDKIKFRTDKMGFVAPEGPWIRARSKEIRTLLESAIEETGIFKTDLLPLFDEFVSGKSNKNQNFFFRILMFYRFLKVFNLEVEQPEKEYRFN